LTLHKFPGFSSRVFVIPQLKITIVKLGRKSVSFENWHDHTYATEKQEHPIAFTVGFAKTIFKD